ncbi:RNA polymerase sigma factor [Oscillospiraceae bacterium PP1C4]
MKPNFIEIQKFVKQTKCGDTQAFTRLYELTYQRVYFLAYSILENQHDAQDVVQETYIKVLSNIHSLENDRLFIAWLNKIAYSISIRAASKNKPILLEEEQLHLILDDREESNIISKAIAEEKAKILSEIIDELATPLKTTVILKYYEGLKIKQIAEIMDCPEGTVKSRLKTAKKLLKSKIINGRGRDILLGAFTYLPIREALSFSAQRTTMDPIFAQTALANALSQNGMSSMIRFTPQPSSPSQSANTTTFATTAGVSGVGILSIALTFSLLSPTFTSIHAENKSGGYTNQAVHIAAQISSAHYGISNLYAVDDEGLKYLPLSFSDNKGIFEFKKNGTYTLFVVGKNNNKVSSSISIDYIDKDAPTLENYNYDQQKLVIYLSDNLSGVDCSNVYGQGPNGTMIYPTEINQEAGTIIFDYPKGSFKLFISDLAGNTSTYTVEPLQIKKKGE